MTADEEMTMAAEKQNHRKTVLRRKIEVDRSMAEISSEPEKDDKSSADRAPLQPIVWRNIIAFIILHSSLFYGLYALIFLHPWKTVAFGFALGITSGIGITAGAHRLWSHRAYKARLPLRILLAFAQTVAGQNDIYEWCRDHRVHHMFAETDADPHNARRGFFFAHMGWLCMHKHPAVKAKGATVDCSDLLADPVVVFQKRYYIPLVILCSFVLPALIPAIFWQDGFNGFMMAGLARYCLSLHLTWLVNSAAHLWGTRPYNKQIGARENGYVVLGSMGEGFHNYHHTFPWDYATSELGCRWNLTTVFIDTMAAIGLAYDRRTAASEIIEARIARTGDLSQHYSAHDYSIFRTS